MAAYKEMPQIQLTSMIQLADVSRPQKLLVRRDLADLRKAVDSDDDWTGITNAASRRKKQNRLNVRAYRM